VIKGIMDAFYVRWRCRVIHKEGTQRGLQCRGLQYRDVRTIEVGLHFLGALQCREGG